MYDAIPVVAGADFSADGQYKAIAIGGTIAAANDAAMGLLQNKPKSGEDAALTYTGRSRARVGAAVSAGDRLKVTTSGWLTGVSSGDGACAKSLETVTSGGICEVICDFVGAATTI